MGSGFRDIIDLTDEAHRTAVSKGWHEVPVCAEKGELGQPPQDVNVDRLGSLLALVHSEVSEALECVRRGEYAGTTREDGKPEGLPSELADIVIRVMDISGALGINLDSAIRRKMNFNATRPHRHGGKRL
jgi:NTP pyrophosphatase (non-canonical NTP hydrolase)